MTARLKTRTIGSVVREIHAHATRAPSRLEPQASTRRFPRASALGDPGDSEGVGPERTAELAAAYREGRLRVVLRPARTYLGVVVDGLGTSE